MRPHGAEMAANNTNHDPQAKAKIVATLGPASSSPEIIRALIQAGADAFRLNFSHGGTDWHRNTAAAIRAAAGNTPVAVIADLQGPRIRIGKLPNPVPAEKGDEILLAPESKPSHPDVIPVTYEALAEDVKPGNRILIDNGLVELRVLDCKDGLVRCRVITGGEIGANKGVNLPGVNVSAPARTDKHKKHAEAAVEFGADYLALSFVREAEDVVRLREFLNNHGARKPIIAKIERSEAVEHIEGIIAASDGPMVARGDLGVELAEEKVPGIQKRIIALANAAGKPVITATEMLQSMVNSPRPTRAEASDVANAILDGTDAVMLSGETAVGAYPSEAVETMERITREAEKIRQEWPPAKRQPNRPSAPQDFASAAADAACAAAAKIHAAAIAVFTMSGRTAGLVAQLRPATTIIALTPNQSTRRALALVWGVTSLLLPQDEGADEMVAAADWLLKQQGILRAGDVAVIVGGSGPLTGATNFAKMHTIR